MKNQLHVDLVAGARPNFMKLAPVVSAFRDQNQIATHIVHTGQHYDNLMNDVFFAELKIPAPEVHLEIGSGSHGQQTGRILEKYEAHLIANRPAATIVFGDVNSTIACALAAVKLGVPVIHVEAGLRSFDRNMPEEINRLLTDAISELLLVTEESGVENLRREGVPDERIRLVGNVMIDTLVASLEKLDGSSLARLGVVPSSYGLATLHRPSNVDEPKTLERILILLRELAERLPMVFPIHPRTRKMAEQSGFGRLLECSPRLHCLPPISYFENLELMRSAKLVLTDSGGMQEETTFLRVPCLTLRDNTERPATTTIGTSRLVGNDSVKIREAFERVLSGDWPSGGAVPLWDGHAAARVASEILTWLDHHSR